jgi:putative FmdB family regulatory protein
MILYTYKCGTCEVEFDAWSTLKERNTSFLCEQCGCVANRVITPVPTQWNTKGNDPDFPSAYSKWATDREKRYQRALKLDES